MERVWYYAQIYPPPDECVRQLNTTISWYVWRGEIFRVPLSTLQRRKCEGGWDLIHITAKSCALFAYHPREQGLRSGTLTSEWLRSWGLMAQNKNPPYRDRIPATLEYLRRYAVDVAYVTQQGSTEPQSTCKRWLYDLYALHVSGGNRIQGDADHQLMATNSLAYSIENPGGNTCSWGH